MTQQISVEDADIHFSCNEGETILSAAERAGYAIPYSCRKGVCSSCEGWLSRGAVRQRSNEIVGPAGRVLFCSSIPKTDLVIKPRRIQRHDPLARKTIQARVFRLSRPTDDVAVLQLRFPASIRARFKAGQYLRIKMPDGDARSFSMANAPQESDGVQLHIRHIPGGVFSEQVLASLKLDDRLNIELPFGDFHIREHARYAFLATGTGFAPLRSMIDDMIRRRSAAEVRLYWGGRCREDLYLAELCERWARRHAWFSFVPVLSEPTADWQGRRGFVHDAVLRDIPDLSDWQVYACGNPLMVQSARDQLIMQAGLNEERFFADAFVPSGAVEQPAMTTVG
ncbi:MAG: 2Fe-2S iron-sulfur cluster-binding protein [Pseudorhodoplanes sp.]